MNRLLLVVAVIPLFALLLAAVIGVSVRYRLGGGGPAAGGGRRTVERLAPALYAATVTAAAVTAAVLTGADPERLGLWQGDRLLLPEAPWAAGPVVGSAVVCGAVAGAAGYLGELFLAHRRVRTAEAADGARTGAPGTRAAGTWAGSPGGLLALGLVTAFAEEVLFRGYLLTGLRGAVPLWAALALQAVLFGAHHASFGLRAVPAKAVHGFVWGVLTVASGSLLPAVAAHLVFQFLACRRLVRRRPDDAGEGGPSDDAAHGTAAVRRPPVVR